MVETTISSLLPHPAWNASDAVKDHNDRSIALYKKLMSKGVCREQARGVLPQNLYTKYYGTVNLHNLLKFIALRSHEGAQWEIQEVAMACLKIAQKHFPESISAWKKSNGYEHLESPGVE